MKTVNTAELTGRALDAAVGLAEGATLKLHQYACLCPLPPVWVLLWEDGNYEAVGNMPYSSDATLAYDIIERENITTVRFGTKVTDQWEAFYLSDDDHYLDVTVGEDGIRGPDPLIAAMRAHVMRKVGHTVELPEDLL